MKSDESDSKSVSEIIILSLGSVAEMAAAVAETAAVVPAEVAAESAVVSARFWPKG